MVYLHKVWINFYCKTTTLKVFNFAGTMFRECRIFSNSRVFNFANHGKIVISRV